MKIKPETANALFKSYIINFIDETASHPAIAEGIKRNGEDGDSPREVAIQLFRDENYTELWRMIKDHCHFKEVVDQLFELSGNEKYAL